MSIRQVCLLIALNLLAGTFLAWQKRSHESAVGSAVLLATIFLELAMMWQSIA